MLFELVYSHALCWNSAQNADSRALTITRFQKLTFWCTILLVFPHSEKNVCRSWKTELPFWFAFCHHLPFSSLGGFFWASSSDISAIKKEDSSQLESRWSETLKKNLRIEKNKKFDRKKSTNKSASERRQIEGLCWPATKVREHTED